MLAFVLISIFQFHYYDVALSSKFETQVGNTTSAVPSLRQLLIGTPVLEIGAVLSPIGLLNVLIVTIRTYIQYNSLDDIYTPLSKKWDYY